PHPLMPGLQPAVVLLKDGTDQSQGKGQLLSNINACLALKEIVQTTLGPRGMDKLMATSNVGRKPVISNDGATIMKLLDVVHPAARVLVDISRAQDTEVGDGTTSVVVLAGSLLEKCKPYVENGVHSRTIMRAYRRSCDLAVSIIKECQVSLSATDDRRERLERLAATALNSKLVSTCREQFAAMAVDAVETLGPDGSLEDIGIKQVTGGALQNSQLLRGVAFKRTFHYAGHGQLSKSFDNPKVLCLNVELEWKSERDNAEIRITDPQKYQEVVDAEFRILYEKLDTIVASGANVVLSKLPIGDLATQYFASKGLFCAGRVPDDDLSRVARATGGRMLTATSDIDASALGVCERFEEKQVGAERFNFFYTPKSSTVTFILRGGAEQFIAESERSLHDAVCIVRRAMKAPAVVAGGGAIEMLMSTRIAQEAKKVPGKEQLLMEAFAEALEVIPWQLACNAGFDTTEVLNKLRAAHAKAFKAGKQIWLGLDINEQDGVCDTFASHVWEPSLIKLNALRAATEAACSVLSVDQTVRNVSSKATMEASRNKTADMRNRMDAAGMDGGQAAARGMSGRYGKGH
ncbi:T-complex protein 1, eta subunit, partial [Kipferlia bialata]